MDSRTCSGAALATLFSLSPCLPEDPAPSLPTPVAEVLGWLPEDTETVFVAQGPFEIPAVRKNLDSPPVEESLLLLGLGPLAELKAGAFLQPLRGHQAALLVEGSRKFRAPRGLGLMRYEGCHVVVFDEELGKDGAALAASLQESAAKTEEIEGHAVHRFERRAEGDTWDIYVVSPRPDVVLSATNREYLREVLARLKKRGAKRALPEGLPEWKQADTRARFWAIRHYIRDAAQDPSSPLHGKGPLSDPEAVGLTFAFDAGKGKTAAVVHLTGNPKGSEALSKVWGDEEHGLKPTVRPHTGRVEIRVEVERETAGDFLFLLLSFLGHGIFL